MIVVYTSDDERLECDGANRFRTDEHNNLEVFTGAQNNPDYVACFAQGSWLRVVIENA